MYIDFYKLKEKPFNLTPSSRFLYLSGSHKEALALLTYGVMERKGFILLTGEVGTGKTTMVQALLNRLDDTVQYVYLSNPLLSPKDFIDYLTFSALNKNVHFQSKAEFILEFEQFLRQCLQHQKNFVLIIDEAQKLSFDLLEEVRLLSNMETGDQKLINIFLVGQPELNDKLSEQQCRPLLQRISIRHHISPLNFEETREYINTRLKVAGAKDSYNIFSKSAINALHNYSQGYPRMINVLADNTLLLGYSREKRKITPEMVKQCYDDMKLENSFLESSLKIPKSYEIRKIEPVRPNGYWKWAFLLLFIIISAVAVRSDSAQSALSQLAALIPVSQKAPVGEVSEQQVVVKKKINEKIDVVTKNPMEKEVLPGDQIEQKESDTLDVVLPGAPEIVERPTLLQNKPAWKTVIVKKGDSFSKLVSSVYGRADEKIQDLVYEHNLQIKDPNQIEVGQEIIFPPLPASD